jgi:hypothetical protein
MAHPTDEQIRNRAHQLREENGKPAGREMEFWLQAEKELKGANLPQDDTPKPLAPD